MARSLLFHRTRNLEGNQVKVIIAGSRTISLSVSSLDLIIASEFRSPITEVVSGACPKGIDKVGRQWAIANKIPLKEFPADWDKYGPFAGPIRNREMAEYADALILIWNGKSKGSHNMLIEALQVDILICEVVYHSETDKDQTPSGSLSRDYEEVP